MGQPRTAWREPSSHSCRGARVIRAHPYNRTMVTVSLTTFIDFVSATGTARLTKVRQARKQYEQEWEPTRDFYKPLRDRISRCAAQGWNADNLRKMLADVKDPKKLENY